MRPLCWTRLRLPPGQAGSGTRSSSLHAPARVGARRQDRGMDAEWRKAGGILMTDAPIRAYGGLRIPRDALEDFARRVTAGEVPLHAHHDNRVRMRNLRVDVVDREDGVSLLRFVTDRHKGDDQWLWAISKASSMARASHSWAPSPP